MPFNSTIIDCRFRKELADTITPVTAYLRIRDLYPHSILLESADSRAAVNSFSYICINPIASFEVRQAVAYASSPGIGNKEVQVALDKKSDVVSLLDQFVKSIKVNVAQGKCPVRNGVFGFTSYSAIEYFEDIQLRERASSDPFPILRYAAYEYIIGINHFQNELHLVHNCTDGGSEETSREKLDALLCVIRHRDFAVHPFSRKGAEVSSLTDEQHRRIVDRCKQHIGRGDVFQIVPSRGFSQEFTGDELNVYRALRSINPSPYLFYFDYGSFKIFGSSPEAQIVVDGASASIFPIAGTYRRTGDEAADLEAARLLSEDPKEVAEHVMLVDLARNDLSKHCDIVEVEQFKEVHFYSHVLHLVSKVTGRLRDGVSSTAILADTFPAGTLTGAPKYRAMELIDEFEPGRRELYAGCIGMYGFDGSCNHAIMIRTFVSSNQRLMFQAGGGIVADSDPDNEVQEVRNKLMALRRAIEIAEEIKP